MNFRFLLVACIASFSLLQSSAQSQAAAAVSTEGWQSSPPYIDDTSKELFSYVFFKSIRTYHPEIAQQPTVGVHHDYDREFGRESSGGTTYGQVLVWYPADRKLGERNWPSTPEDDDPLHNFSVRHVQMLTENEISKKITEVVKTTPRERPLIYVHGYNNSFVQSMRNAAQLNADGQVGVVVTYSWPGDPGMPVPFDAPLINLSPMYKTVLLVEVAKAQLPLLSLVDLVASAGKKPNLIAHSAGARVFFRSYERSIKIASEHAHPLHNVILAAPDIPASEFRKYYIGIVKNIDNIEYFCTPDRALFLGAVSTDFEVRLGYCSRKAPEYLNVKATFIDTDYLDGDDLFRHSYFLLSTSALKEIQAVFSGRAN